MFINVKKEEIKADNIIYFQLGNHEELIPCRIARIDDSQSEIAYINFDVENISICKDQKHDYYIKPFLKKEIGKELPEGVPISRLDEAIDVQKTSAYLEFKGKVLSISSPDDIINKYTKDLEVGVLYVEVLSSDDCKFTIKLSSIDLEDNPQVGDTIFGVVSVISIIVERKLF